MGSITQRTPALKPEAGGPCSVCINAVTGIFWAFFTDPPAVVEIGSWHVQCRSSAAS